MFSFRICEFHKQFIILQRDERLCTLLIYINTTNLSCESHVLSGKYNSVMKKTVLFIIITFAIIGIFSMNAKNATAQVVDTPTPTPSVSTNQSNQTQSSSQFSSSENQPTPTPIPPSSPFNYMPLPATHGPEQDITEVTPLIASRSSAQVDDWISFTTTIKNTSVYTKNLQTVCFESTDGNFGCDWGISLQPGQTDTINNVGSWTSGGTKNVWITWSQDGINYYQPMDATTVTINILG